MSKLSQNSSFIKQDSISKMSSLTCQTHTDTQKHQKQQNSTISLWTKPKPPNSPHHHWLLQQTIYRIPREAQKGTAVDQRLKWLRWRPPRRREDVERLSLFWDFWCVCLMVVLFFLNITNHPSNKQKQDDVAGLQALQSLHSAQFAGVLGRREARLALGD